MAGTNGQLHAVNRALVICYGIFFTEELAAKDLLVMDIIVGKPPQNSELLWERRPDGIWVRKGEFNNKINDFVTKVDVFLEWIPSTRGQNGLLFDYLFNLKIREIYPLRNLIYFTVGLNCDFGRF